MLVLLARAKINWTLDILGLLPNGYHRMDMLMSSVSLADELTLEPADELTLSILGKPDLSADDNLVLKAAETLRSSTGCKLGAKCTLEKRIPIGAGMGGGSADAAAALTGLNRLWNTGLTPVELQTIGFSVGADVPFMLAGGFARVGGAGEEIETIKETPSVSLVIIQPCKALSTREVFAEYDALTGARHPDTPAVLKAIQGNNLEMLERSACNVLQQASERLRPQIAEAQAALTACGAVFASMTGSGSAVFGAFTSEKEADSAYSILHGRWRKCWRTETVDEGIVFKENQPDEP